ncbi:phage shock protein PspC (stress-responsive transcriptional regulator) [Dysgonomonas alginatilytica]|uniref:Phage shock protein PspC (Stress-responsive transcriptional regulator) n=1 Tax=Dysgonomonas alginatilytica TaxID=1605892 RepID=A0A2V3PRQ7_9BACT|nr:PspC domain-containing protein [Dysgonomonas alginatilytica]PXV67456.1 phage shock protein PspC (stress-responsive transcriptional regulator) [Dysgonomonas alginatilytica]
MKETIKASIGGYAFTLDADAYEILKSYLDNLKLHFENKEDGTEIIADIEARMCELLQMKASKSENIITLEDANSIIGIMGNPVDFEEEATDTDNNSQPEKPENTTIRKKLYRDKENGVLGGVCAGLAKFFHLDPVIVRVAYAASIALAGFATDKLAGYLLASYFLLWIAMPKARTMAQKLAMSGEDPSIEAIENRTAKIPRKRESHMGSVLGSIIKAVCGTIIFMIGIGIILLGGFAIFFPAIVDLPSVGDFLIIFGFYSSNINIALAILWFLPAICLIYLGIIIYTKITPKDFVIFGIAFLIWIGAGSYIGIISTKQAKNYYEDADFTERVHINTTSDTLHVRLHPDLQSAYHWGKNENELYTLDGDPKSWFVFPKVRVNQDTIYKNFEIKIKKTAFDRSFQAAKAKATDAKFSYNIHDSLVLLKPHLYNRNHPWNRELFEIEINSPLNKTVIIDEPINYRHHFSDYWDND